MINYYKLVPGNLIYQAVKIPNPDRKKVTYTDHEGNWWYGYEGKKEINSYTTLEVTGVLQKSVLGFWENLDNIKPEIYVLDHSNGKNKIITYKDFDSQTNKYFVDKQLAIEYCSLLESDQ